MTSKPLRREKASSFIESVKVRTVGTPIGFIQAGEKLMAERKAAQEKLPKPKQR